MKLTNYEIYTYSQSLGQAFTKRDQRLPAKLSFCVLKNTQTLNNLVQEIEESRIEIIEQYGKIIIAIIAILALIVGGAVVISIAGLAFSWFVIHKKTWDDLLALLEKKK